MRVGWYLRRMSRMPRDSNWNTPLVKPLEKICVGLLVVERQILR